MTLVAIATSSTPDQKGAILAVTDGLKPSTPAEIDDALIKLNELVDPPYDSDAETRLSEYRARLLTYPRDAVLTALHEWPDRHVKWPKWSELRDALEGLSLRRRRMLVAIQGMNAKQTEDELYPPGSEADLEEVRAIRDRTLAALQGSGRPKKPERRPIDDRLEAMRAAEADHVEAALHQESAQ
jgi:hypothetical protein